MLLIVDKGDFSWGWGYVFFRNGMGWFWFLLGMVWCIDSFGIMRGVFIVEGGICGGVFEMTSL